MKEFRKKIYALISNGKKRSIANRIYNAIVIMVTIISLSSLMFKEDHEAFYTIDIIAGIIFLIDYILRWMTADFKYRYKHITDRRAFLIYPFRLHAILDLLAIISTLPAFFGGMRMIEAFDTMRLFRVIKCIRIFKLLKYSSSFNIIYVILQKQKKVLLTVLVIAASYIFVSAVIVFQIEPETFPTFFDAIYWAVISLTTVGYGDIYPTSVYGRLFSMVSAFFGIAFVALPAGIISGGYLEVIMEQKSIEKENEKEKSKEKNQ
ncbi:MAG: ion transporter [Clostridiales bacterium]|nr:ion transporter [Clostridiales bacterium]